jgi:hypothetical protein
MSAPRVFLLVALGCAVAFLVGMAVLDASCHGDFVCGSAGDEAFGVTVFAGGIGVVSLLLAGLFAAFRRRS